MNSTVCWHHTLISKTILSICTEGKYSLMSYAILYVPPVLDDFLQMFKRQYEKDTQWHNTLISKTILGTCIFI